MSLLANTVTLIRGKNIEEMSRDELLKTVRMLGRQLESNNQNIRSIVAINELRNSRAA